uniref:Myb-like domain-containing protein n=1 Tax=Haemonchus contortus TaxID=6289 RepID=A0A7I4Y3U3_HAECO
MTGEVNKSIFQKQRISLRLWAFKYIDVEDIKSFGVCVEGYRPSDDTATTMRNWHSTAIQRRISSSLLESCTGTIYELRGSIDKELAFQYGYPFGLVTAFEYGFPENWRDILKQYFDVVKTTNPLNASHHFSMLARRRSLNTVRGQNKLQETPGQGERRTSFAASTTLPPTIYEESEHEITKSSTINNTREAQTDRGEEHFCADASDTRSSSTASLEKHENKSLVNGSNELTNSAISSDSSISFLPRQNEDPSKIDKQSPAPINSQSQSIDVSPGPLFEEPTSTKSPQINEATEGNAHTEENHPELALVQVPPRVEKPLPLKEKSDDAVELSQWSIRFAPLYSGPPLGFPKFVILGTRESHPNKWQTSVIVRVANARILYTNSTRYRLVGDIDTMDCASAGFPKEFVGMFLSGFPPDWRTRITELYDSIFGHLEASQNMIETSKDRRKEAPGHQLFEDDDDEVENFHFSHRVADSNRPLAKVSAHNRSPVDVSIRKSSSKSVNRDLVPSSSQAPIPAVRRSRSGRCIRPPLAEWAGQRVRYDGAGNIIGVEDIMTSTKHPRGANITMALSDYYGVPLSATSRQVEKYRKPQLAVNRRLKKAPRRGTLVEYSDSSDSERRNEKRYREPFSSDEDIPKRKRAIRSKKVGLDDHEIEKELRKDRLLLLEEARNIRKMQEKLLMLEKRITEKEEIWLRKSKLEKKLAARSQRHYYDDREEREEINLREKQNVMKSKQNVMKNYPKYNKRTAFRDDEERRYFEEKRLERKRFQEEWDRENEQISSGSDDIDDDSWCEPVRKRKKQPARKIQAKTSSSEISSLDDEMSGDELDESIRKRKEQPQQRKKEEKKEKGWSKVELHRLKLTLAAIRVVTDDDWEKVARSLGNDRSPESCKQAAIKRLKWEPPSDKGEPPPITSEIITARTGTIAHQHQTNEYTRKFMMGAGEQGDDFFRQNNVSLSESIPNVTEFGADDSLLEVLRTPVDVAVQRKGPKRGQFFPEPIDDDTPIRRRSSCVLMATPTNSAQRERQDRYLHHIMHKSRYGNDVSRMNHTRNTTRTDTFRDYPGTNKMNTFASLHEDLEDVAKMTRKATRKRIEELDENSDMELELDENHFDDSGDFEVFRND